MAGTEDASQPGWVEPSTATLALTVGLFENFIVLFALISYVRPEALPFHHYIDPPIQHHRTHISHLRLDRMWKYGFPHSRRYDFVHNCGPPPPSTPPFETISQPPTHIEDTPGLDRRRRYSSSIPSLQNVSQCDFYTDSDSDYSDDSGRESVVDSVPSMQTISDDAEYFVLPATYTPAPDDTLHSNVIAWLNEGMRLKVSPTSKHKCSPSPSTHHHRSAPFHCAGGGSFDSGPPPPDFSALDGLPIDIATSHQQLDKLSFGLFFLF
ncbi:hypothetical protein B0H19DRAFT_1247438 [Mycena capillaripes]|nr:hypothetical protein B0H19DRAFT_1247438 [Mycena capillaripes]